MADERLGFRKNTSSEETSLAAVESDSAPFDQGHFEKRLEAYLNEAEFNWVKDKTGDYVVRFRAEDEYGNIDHSFCFNAKEGPWLTMRLYLNEWFIGNHLELLAVCNDWNLSKKMPTACLLMNAENGSRKRIILEMCIPVAGRGAEEDLPQSQMEAALGWFQIGAESFLREHSDFFRDLPRS